jgi:hypothetical protein
MQSRFWHLRSEFVPEKPRGAYEQDATADKIRGRVVAAMFAHLSGK